MKLLVQFLKMLTMLSVCLISDPEGIESLKGNRANINKCVGSQWHSPNDLDDMCR